MGTLDMRTCGPAKARTWGSGLGHDDRTTYGLKSKLHHIIRPSFTADSMEHSVFEWCFRIVCGLSQSRNLGVILYGVAWPSATHIARVACICVSRAVRFTSIVLSVVCAGRPSRFGEYHQSVSHRPLGSKSCSRAPRVQKRAARTQITGRARLHYKY